MLTYSLLYELEDQLTEKELEKLETEMLKDYEAYSEAINKLEKEQMLAEEAALEAQIELREKPEYKELEQQLVSNRWRYYKKHLKIETIKILTFGMNIKQSGTVSTLDWELFKRDYIVPLFPGFTERKVKGNWESKSEPSIELLIACEDNDTNNKKIEKIMKAYNKAFDQDCVMKTNADNTVEFYKKR